MFRCLTLPIVAVLLLGAAPSNAPAQDAPAPRAAATTPGPSTLVNINTATPEQLEALPGIGAKTATRIVEYRQKNGGFKKVEDLMNIQGIGEKNFLRLKPFITVGAPRAAGQ